MGSFVLSLQVNVLLKGSKYLKGLIKQEDVDKLNKNPKPLIVFPSKRTYAKDYRFNNEGPTSIIRINETFELTDQDQSDNCICIESDEDQEN